MNILLTLNQDTDCNIEILLVLRIFMMRLHTKLIKSSQKKRNEKIFAKNQKRAFFHSSNLQAKYIKLVPITFAKIR
jgi:hypothetical protein